MSDPYHPPVACASTPSSATVMITGIYCAIPAAGTTITTVSTAINDSCIGDGDDDTRRAIATISDNKRQHTHTLAGSVANDGDNDALTGSVDDDGEDHDVRTHLVRMTW